MKKYINILLWAPLTLLFALLLAGCSEDFLERPPLDQLTDASYYNTDDEVLMGVAPLYNVVWHPFIDNAKYTLGDLRAGNMRSNDRQGFYEFSVPAGAGEVYRAWQSFYNVIGQSNMAMYAIDNNAGEMVSPEAINHAKAEARFMRGLSYMYLVMNWKEVPVIHNNILQMTDTTISRNTVESVWDFLIKDVKFAVDHLPEQAIANGRLSTWSAKGMLARMYLYRSGLNGNGTRNQTYLDSARHYAGEVVKNSGLALMGNYGDLFLTANNNNGESLFALQWMALPPGGPWGVGNPTQAYFAFDPAITGTGDGWGRGQGASADIVRYYMANPADSLRRKATFMFNGDFYPDLNASNGGTEYDINDIANLKKYIVGTPDDNDGKGSMMSTGINSYMLRLAEVYLIYAEAILGNQASTSDPEALQYYNAVRERAGLPGKASITYDDILTEKRIELAMEGNFWYELVALYYFNPEKAKNIIGNQDKGPYEINVPEDEAGPFQREFVFPEANDQGVPHLRYFPVADNTMFLPYPEVEMARAPNLRKEPVPFVMPNE